MSLLITDTQRQQIIAALADLDHVLPGQAPILHFVHHNTLHGFQHLAFEQAIAETKKLTGVNGYLPQAEFLRFYQQGRITDADIAAALSAQGHLKAQEVVLQLDEMCITRGDIFRIALLYDLEAVSPNQLAWQIEELAALKVFQSDVPKKLQAKALNTQSERSYIKGIWHTLLQQLEIEQSFLHPENMLDLSLDQAEALLAQHRASRKKVSLKKISMHEQMCEAANKTFVLELQRLGGETTLRSFLLALCGVDILDNVRPEIIRICSSALDEGVASWQLPGRSKAGMYAAWRAVVGSDINPFLQELPDWQAIVAELPEQSEDAIILQLSYFGIPSEQWAGYLRCLALEIPGWSGMVNWREQHPDYVTPNDTKPRLADYLAIRLTLDRLWLNQICRDTWQIEATVSSLQTYFRKNPSEYMVRTHLFRGDLPEYLIEQAEAITLSVGTERFNRTDWQYLADIIWTWQINNLTNCRPVHSVYDSAWRLFRLSQHLGLSVAQLARVEKAQLEHILLLLEEFTVSQRDLVWLCAYEQHYRQDLLFALHHNRGQQSLTPARPEAQIIFCIDDREEGFRRHVEAVNPAIATLGAAGFFGLAINYRGFAASAEQALCPVVIKPMHAVHEVAQAHTDSEIKRYQQGKQRQRLLTYLHMHSLRRNLLLAPFYMALTAPFTALRLLSRVFLPGSYGAMAHSVRQCLTPPVPTTLVINAADTTPATPAQPKLGFTDSEQAERVAGFLRNCGLSSQFSPLVVLMGHGSNSVNNAHLATYDCGACSGRHGGPNARAFAAMANRPAVRTLLAAKGIAIPADTWFIGAEHNTASEEILWFDLHTLPAELFSAVAKLQADLALAAQHSAHERCRRMMSAPRKPTLKQALAHVQQRAVDFSQTRPELGHATKAALLVGRRAMSQGLFLDRRSLLCSYDATQDPEGQLLEGVLAAVIPVGAGINLEYYFSTVDPQGFGCGTKVLHNIIGLIGVMEGAGSDLRTGLPKQMTEIHEAMRLQVVVEAKPAVLERIMQQHAGIREFIVNNWVYLNVLDPVTGEISVYHAQQGFTPWQVPAGELAVYTDAAAYYQGSSEPLPPVQLRPVSNPNVEAMHG